MNRRLLAAVVLLALAPVLAAADNAPVYKGPKLTLQQQYPVGTQEMTISQKGANDMTIAGMKQQQKMENLFVAELITAKPEADGSRKVTISYKRFKQHIEVGPMVMTYDSSDPNTANSPIAGMLKPMLSVKLTMTIGADGNIQKMEGLDKMWEEMAKGNPQMAPMVEQMKKQMGDKSLPFFQQAQLGLPAQPVGPGDTWRNDMTMEVPMIGKAVVRQDCTLKDVQTTPAGKIALIEVKGSVKSDQAKPLNMGQGAMTLKEMDIKQEGQIRFNADTGVLDSQSLQQTGGFSFSMPGPDGQQIESQISMDMKTEIANKFTPESK